MHTMYTLHKYIVYLLCGFYAKSSHFQGLFPFGSSFSALILCSIIKC